jgi:cholinesterase
LLDLLDNMFCQLSFLALVASTTALSTSDRHGPSTNASLTVKTTSGRVHGKFDAAQPDVRQFLGIPYAQPPVGNLRWLAPQPLSQPEQEIEATELGPSCLQFLNTNSSGVYTSQVLEYNLQGLNRTGVVSEDCLRLSVYAPAEKKRRSCDNQKGKGYGRGRGRGDKGKGLPVLIYFYGGAFSMFGLLPNSLTHHTD